MLTVQDVLDQLGYDFVDPMIERKINRLIAFADAYLKESIHKNYPKDDPEAKELALMIVEDMWDKNESNSKVSANVERLVNSTSLHLILKMRDKTNGV